MADNTVKIKATLDDKVSGGLAKIRDKLDQVGGKGTASVAFGVLAAKGLTLIGSAAGELTGFLEDSTKAAMAEQETIDQLNASLKANIKGWNGNTDAIEATLRAREDLAFSDDEQRVSLSLLLAATNDVTKSLELERAAMDLARLKHVDLQTATEALIRVDDGHYRVLQSLGIEVRKNATSTEVLAAVQKAATGQAEAYANTTSGKLLQAQIHINDAMEKMGAIILPVLDVALTNLSLAFRYISGDPTVKLTGAMKTIADAIGFVISVVKNAISWLGDLVGAVGSAIRALQDLIGMIYKTHTAQQGIDYHTTGQVPGHAEGGWVGMSGEEIIRVGEKGPEYVIPNNQLASAGATGGGGLTVQFNTIWPPTPEQARAIAGMVDGVLASSLGRAAPTLGRI
jgi:hypothetical protein